MRKTVCMLCRYLKVNLLRVIRTTLLRGGVLGMRFLYTEKLSCMHLFLPCGRMLLYHSWNVNWQSLRPIILPLSEVSKVFSTRKRIEQNRALTYSDQLKKVKHCIRSKRCQTCSSQLNEHVPKYGLLHEYSKCHKWMFEGSRTIIKTRYPSLYSALKY